MSGDQWISQNWDEQVPFVISDFCGHVAHLIKEFPSWRFTAFSLSSSSQPRDRTFDLDSPTPAMSDHQYKFNVSMSCGGCSGAVERVLKRLEGMLLSNLARKETTH